MRARDEREHRCDVVAGDAVDQDVPQPIDDPRDDRERAAHECDQSPHARTPAGIDDSECKRHGSGDEPARKVVRDRGAGLAVHERVVQHG